MTTLEVNDLVEGNVYRCVLSDRKVLIVNKQDKTFVIHGKEYTEHLANGVAYNPVRGEHEMIMIWNGQLEPISERR